MIRTRSMLVLNISSLSSVTDSLLLKHIIIIRDGLLVLTKESEFRCYNIVFTECIDITRIASNLKRSLIHYLPRL